MVESVKPTTIKANDLRIGAVTRVANTAPAVTTAPAQTPAAAAAPTLARVMAASAPLDVARVALIKEAVEAGRFPLSPASVADALIAAKYEWMSHDAS
ncbi:flagellar biosynthesis anti-sigma factor FlgM [Sphingomonas sp. Mn802worker]|uniref:flagellar biosynthesis anti-sigma factor FlgM n=1 Tax=Sphingomonas sp. Mn802worker TaxID=629773 RepID=UPI00036927FF|nr:flagellar biosynthesis anti-sigma factor FlgM [Sphingomonas sp. Mn802worker]